MITTAYHSDNTHSSIRDIGTGFEVATPLAMGAGHVDANHALNSGLIYDATAQDYVNLLCATLKVCDICGDAGREDLLAVCCSCSEGVEYTYCMKEMMDTIPEGDWLCKDCKSEKRKAREKEKYDLVDGDGVDFRNVDLCGKLDGLDTDAKDIKADKDGSHVKLSRKREADNAEVSSAAKRQVFESKIRSPYVSSPTRAPYVSSPTRAGMFSRDSSFKNLDRERVKHAYQIPPGLQTSKGAPGVAYPSLDAQLHTSRGTFSRSKSFSSGGPNLSGTLKVYKFFIRIIGLMFLLFLELWSLTSEILCRLYQMTSLLALNTEYWPAELEPEYQLPVSLLQDTGPFA